MCRDGKCKVRPLEPDDDVAQCAVCGDWWFLTSAGYWQRFSDQCSRSASTPTRTLPHRSKIGPTSELRSTNRRGFGPSLQPIRKAREMRDISEKPGALRFVERPAMPFVDSTVRVRILQQQWTVTVVDHADPANSYIKTTWRDVPLETE